MKEVNVAILGMGTVGGGIYRLIEMEKDNIAAKHGVRLNVKKTLALDYSVDVPDEKKAKDIDEIANDPDITIVAEVMGGIHPAKDFELKVLKAGKTVVSANKDMISQNWPDLEQAAKEGGVGHYFEAAVGGAIPILRAINDSLQANTIDEVFGIVNGTTNYILTMMEDKGQDFDEALAEAQRLGYAEANPTSDIDGLDARYKLSILASLCFHGRVPVDKIYCEGIRNITKADIDNARELGYTVKLLAIGKRDENGAVEARVHPTMIPTDHALASIKGEFNAIFVHGNAVGDMMWYGKGAGDLPTASALVSDMVYAVKNGPQYTTFDNTYEADEIVFNDNWITGYCINLVVADKPGVLAGIAKTFQENNVSIQQLVQKPGNNDGSAPLVIVTHPAHELDLRASVDSINKLPDILETPKIIRVEQ